MGCITTLGRRSRRRRWWWWGRLLPKPEEERGRARAVERVRPRNFSESHFRCSGRQPLEQRVHRLSLKSIVFRRFEKDRGTKRTACVHAGRRWLAHRTSGDDADAREELEDSP